MTLYRDENKKDDKKGSAFSFKKILLTVILIFVSGLSSLSLYLIVGAHTSESCPVVLYYHHVNPKYGPISPEVFSTHLDYLQKEEWKTVTLNELKDHIEGKKILPEKSVMITFDDGLLDNWVYALPELEKRNMTAVFYVIPGRVPTGSVRISSRNFNSKEGVSSDDLPYCGQPWPDLWNADTAEAFMTWSEIRAAEATGVIEIGVHGWKHAHVHTGQKPIGFYTPFSPDNYMWPPDPRPLPGYPLFKLGHANFHNRVSVNQEILDEFSEWYSINAPALITRYGKDVDAHLWKKWNEMTINKDVYSYESDEDRYARVYRDLRRGKLITESELGHSVDTLAWPWGAHDVISTRAARDNGFTMAFITKKGDNLPGVDAMNIHRFNVERADKNWFADRMKLHANAFLINAYAKVYRRF